MFNWVFAWWTNFFVTMLQFSLQYKIEWFGDILENMKCSKYVIKSDSQFNIPWQTIAWTTTVLQNNIATKMM
jgi:hypothetical protein